MAATITDEEYENPNKKHAYMRKRAREGRLHEVNI